MNSIKGMVESIGSAGAVWVRLEEDKARVLLWEDEFDPIQPRPGLRVMVDVSDIHSYLIKVVEKDD